jgi:hypothetical protein
MSEGIGEREYGESGQIIRAVLDRGGVTEVAFFWDIGYGFGVESKDLSFSPGIFQFIFLFC